MKYIVKEIPQNHGYLIPIGDIHWGDKGFTKNSKKKLKGYLDWVKERDNACIFLMGDIFNVAGRESPTSPFESSSSEYEEVIDFFEPYKDKIIGAIEGNHCERIFEEFGFSPLALFCKTLGIPYCRYSAIVRFRVGKRKNDKSRYNQNYFVFMHHSSGGGGTIGSKMNRIYKERDMVEGCDVYLGGHNHMLGAVPMEIYYPSIQGGIKKRRIWYVDCGSYLDWQDSYAEKGMLAPAKIGSPRIRFDGRRECHDVHISL